MGRRDEHQELIDRLRRGVRDAQGRALFDEPDPGTVQPPPAKKRPECSTGKVRWATAAAARERLDEIVKLGSERGYSPANVVACNKCHGFHLTSRAGKSWHSKKSRPDFRVVK